MTVIKMNDLNIVNKRVLIRSDLNVPVKNGQVTSDTRILAALPTIQEALHRGAKVMVTSHLGRPVEGEYNEKFSLLPIVNYLKSKLKDIKITLKTDYLDGVDINSDELVVLENVRFNIGENKNDEILSKQYANLCDVFVMDAFGTAHRAQASTHGITKFAPMVCGGPLLLSELAALNKIMVNPLRPLVAVVGGSKVSTKFDVLNSLSMIADHVIVGGGIANTFIAIENKIGKSLYEPSFVEIAKSLRNKCNIVIPTDCRISKELESLEIKCIKPIIKNVGLIEDNEKIMDFGDKSAWRAAELLRKAKTILWNGPVGVFEMSDFRKGTEIIAQTIAQSSAFSVAGGGDTLAAIEFFGIKNKISYISTGGGAFLHFIEGRKLPSVAILEERAKI